MDLMDFIRLIQDVPFGIRMFLMIFLFFVCFGILFFVEKKPNIRFSIFLSIVSWVGIIFLAIIFVCSEDEISDIHEKAPEFFEYIFTNGGPLSFLQALVPIVFQTPMFVLILCFVALCTFVLFFLTRAILGRAVSKNASASFWEHKALAKSKVAWCNLLFFAMLFLICLATYALFGLVFYFFETPYNFEVNCYRNFIICLILTLIVAGIIFGAFLYKSFSKTSLDKLAKSLNAIEITDEIPESGDKDSTLHFKEKQLLNIIAEMALASNMPMPRVFVLADEGINAMCSGENFGKENERIGIFVTQGALKTFSRNELQGVIGHEFSHAFHNDVALNLKIFSLVFGLNCVMLLGMMLLESFSKSRHSSSSRDSGKGVALLLLIAFVLFAIGGLGMLCAQIIQAAISRQKEFLADASSVQYTRNPAGIKSALNKLLRLEARAQNLTKSKETSDSKDSNKLYKKAKSTHLASPAASACAHMFFFPSCKQLFATHPPLQKRIAHLEQMGG